MDRYILNQTALTVKFYRSNPEFYLMTNELGPDYYIDIEDMILKICNNFTFRARRELPIGLP